MAILVYSQAGKYVIKPTLQAAKTDADAAGKTIVVTSPLTADQSNITGGVWPLDRALRVEKGGSINPTTAFSGLPYAESWWFGATADGVTDDTANLQKAVDSTLLLVVTAGTYMVDAVTHLHVPTNIKITFEQGAKFQVITNAADNYAVLFCQYDNVTIENPYLIGDRLTHTGVTGEWGFGITIGGKNVVVNNAYCEKFWGDGVYIAKGSENVTITNYHGSENRRMGLTVAGGKNIKIKDSYVYHSLGTPPQSGFAIEPDDNTAVVDGVIFDNCKSEVCTGGYGFYVNLNTLVDVNAEINVQYINCSDTGSAINLNISNVKESAAHALSGQILVENFTGKNSLQSGIAVFNYAASGTPVLRINNPTTIDCNEDDNAITYGAAINVDRGGKAEDFVMGNVIISNQIVIDTRTPRKTKAGFYAVDVKAVDFANAKYINPIRIDALTSEASVFPNSAGWTIRDGNGILSYTNAGVYDFPTYMYGITRFDNEGSPGGVANMSPFRLNQSLQIDMPMFFKNVSDSGIKIRVPGNVKILPISQTNGKAILTTTVGGNITLRKRNATTYIAESITGTWTEDTNLLSDGSDLTGSAWTSTNATRSSGQFLETAATGVHLINQLFTAVAGQPYTFATSVVPINRPWVLLWFGEEGKGAYFNTATGATGTVSAGITVNATVAIAGGFRFCITLDSAVATTQTVQIYSATADTVFSFAGDIAKGLSVVGAKVEQGTSPTPF